MTQSEFQLVALACKRYQNWRVVKDDPCFSLRMVGMNCYQYLRYLHPGLYDISLSCWILVLSGAAFYTVNESPCFLQLLWRIVSVKKRPAFSNPLWNWLMCWLTNPVKLTVEPYICIGVSHLDGPFSKDITSCLYRFDNLCWNCWDEDLLFLK